MPIGERVSRIHCLAPSSLNQYLKKVSAGVELRLVVGQRGGEADPGRLLDLDGRAVLADGRVGGERDVVLQVGRGALAGDLVADRPGAVEVEGRLLGDEERDRLLPGQLDLVVGNPAVVDEDLQPVERLEVPAASRTVRPRSRRDRPPGWRAMLCHWWWPPTSQEVGSVARRP